MIGQKLAHYEIVEKLGEGGMGEVYKARDHHLDRYIALKLLRSDKLIDADRRRRFVLEAKAASALNHPNIVTIHDIGQADGVDFISMEYVKGRTLHAAAGRRGLPLAEVLKVGMQIADAVAAAHAAGIVHRDLKPANVMVGEQGVVKVLDFGLAKLTEAAPPLETDATRTIGPAGPATEEGYIVGTVAYMAPEQIEGGKIDARADIFAFGALLYEMITGRRAFERESRIATLSAILKDPPPPVAEAAKDVPPELERIVARCLRKDPDRRYQSMRDVRNALEEVKEDSESGRLPSGALPRPAASSSTSAVRAAAVLVLLAAAAGGAWWWTSRGAPAPPELTMRQLTADSGLTTTPAISADGKLVAYASDRATQKDLDIWVQPLAQGAQPIRLTRNEADDLYPSFSPDGGLIVFRSNRDGGGVYLVPALGGEERLLVRGGRSPRFSPDGKWVVYQLGRDHLSESGVYVVSTAGGSSRRLATDVRWAAAPVFSPDGRHVLFTGAPSENAPTGEFDWWVTPVEGGASVKTGIVPELAALGLSLGQIGLIRSREWLNERIVFGAGHIWEVGLSPGAWKSTGPARQLTSGASREIEPRATIAEGRLRMVFTADSYASHLWSLPVEANSGKVSGEPQPLFPAGGSQTQPHASADGRKLIYTQIDPAGASLRLRDLVTGSDTALATVAARGKLSPDGTRVAYWAFAESALYLMPAAGGDAVKLVQVQGRGNLYGWSPDGRKVVYWEGTPIRFRTIDAETHQVADLISHSEKSIHGAEFSPDQRWVTFHIPAGRSGPLYVAPMRDGRAAGVAEWITILDRGAQNNRPWWSPDGNLLYFLTSLDGFWCLYAQRLNSQKHPAGEPFPVHHFHSTRVQVSAQLGGFGLAVLPDQVILSLGEQTGNVWLAEAR